jgi:LacI family transcriptional regulator
MEKRITIRDIAAEAGVSTGTVHRAIYGKKGVSAEIQEKILGICTKREYRANTAASALKRSPLRVVGAFPVPDEKGSFFYSNVWKGFRRCMEEFRDYNIEVVECVYYERPDHNQSAELLACYARYEGKIDALVTIGHFDAEAEKAVRVYTAHNIPVFLACDDAADCGRLACVQANHDMTGRMAAELLSSQLSPGSAVLLCAGDVLIPSHYQTVHGFERYLRENRIALSLIKLYGYSDEQDLRSRLRAELERRDDIRGAFSISARLSILLADAVSSLSRADSIRIVASDLFDEIIRNMEAGIIRNILYKNPEQQAYLATKCLCDYLLKAQRPVNDVQYVESHIIFRSNLDMYR